MGKKSKPEKEAAQEAVQEFQIAPQSTTPKLDTSKWPLLLKHYDKLNVRTGHYTPIPSGYTPLKRCAACWQDSLAVQHGDALALVTVQASSYSFCRHPRCRGSYTAQQHPAALHFLQASAGVHSLWSNQPGQAVKPLLARGGGLDSSHLARGEDGPQRHAGPQGYGEPDCLRGARHQVCLCQEHADGWGQALPATKSS